jgi:DNA-binding SARP family transcriptional activator/tetratricopeptide (TPR) repeat protein
VEFRILGPVELWAAEKQHELGSTKERCLLAVLLLAAGRPVLRDTLIDRVWGENSPAEVAQSLNAYASRLRAALRSAGSRDGAELRSASQTYSLDVDPEKVDFFRSRNLRLQASSMLESGDDQEAARLLYEAESLWRSEPLAGLTGEWAERTRVSLDSEYRAMVLELADIELRRGRHSELVGFLLGLVDRYPFDEDIVDRLMHTYYCCGRQVDAIGLYLTTMRRLKIENGVDPGPRLQERYRSILAHDPSLRFVRHSGLGDIPRFNALPAMIPEFTGRAAEIAALTGTGGPRSGVISIAGMPGVGKTSLAVQAAHALADDFPDAQLYLDLQGHHPQHPAIEPGAALSTLLKAVGVKPSRIPASLAERSRLWRNEVAGRRLLVVLDDAVDSEQVRPLLPDSPDCQVIITGRARLEGLTDARQYLLGVLSVDDAVTLFTRIADPGTSLPAAEVIEAVRLCGRLPLAIRLAAVRVRDDQVSSIGELEEQLRDARENVESPRSPELAAAFELSYRDLDEHQRHVFRSIGVSPVTELTASNVAPLADISESDAERILTELTDQSLLVTIAPGRFGCHDLIRQYARACSRREESEQARWRAVGRALDHYLRTARSADRMLHPYRHRPTATPQPRAFSGGEEAKKWMTAEWRNLAFLVHYCADHERNSHAVDLAEAIADFFDDAGHWEEAKAVHKRALKIGQELEIRPAVGQARLNLAVIHWRTGHTRRAMKDANLARGIFRELQDSAQEAAALDRLGLILWTLSDYRAALAYFGEAGDMFREIGDAYGQAKCMGHIGMGLLHTGRYLKAIRTFERALEMHVSLDDRRGQAVMMNNIGDAKLRLGYYREAEDLYRKSQEVYDSITGRRNSAILLINLGNVARYRGEVRPALDLYRKALADFSQTGDRVNESNVLNNIGYALTDDERFNESLGHHRRALSIADEIGSTFERTRAIIGTADAEVGAGRYAPALRDYWAARGLARDIGDPYLEAQALSGIARATQHTHGGDAARIYWRQAHDLFSQLGDLPELSWVRVRLQALDFASPRPRRRLWLAGQTGENRVM